MSLKHVLEKWVRCYKAKNGASFGLTMGPEGIDRANDILDSIRNCEKDELGLFNDVLDLIKNRLGTSRQLRKYLARALCEYAKIPQAVIDDEVKREKWSGLGFFIDPVAETTAMITLLDKHVKMTGLVMRKLTDEKSLHQSN